MFLLHQQKQLVWYTLENTLNFLVQLGAFLPLVITQRLVPRAAKSIAIVSAKKKLDNFICLMFFVKFLSSQSS